MVRLTRSSFRDKAFLPLLLFCNRENNRMVRGGGRRRRGWFAVTERNDYCIVFIIRVSSPEIHCPWAYTAAGKTNLLLHPYPSDNGVDSTFFCFFLYCLCPFSFSLNFFILSMFVLLPFLSSSTLEHGLLGEARSLFIDAFIKNFWYYFATTMVVKQ